MATGPIHQWARVDAARAERAGGRSVARSGAGSAPGGAERSRGLMNVGKVLSRWDEPLPVVAPHVGAVAVQGIQEPDSEDLGHALADLVGSEPLDGCRL